jgi:hypothetical protein
MTVSPGEHRLADIAEPLARISRQLETVLKLMLKDRQGQKKTVDMIRLLGSLGCSAKDISDWLQAPVTTVAPELSKLKKPQPKRPRR